MTTEPGTDIQMASGETMALGGGRDIPVRVESTSLVEALRRRWLFVLIGGLLLSGLGTAGVWYLVLPEFEVSAQIEVKPVVRSIIADDRESDITRTYTTHMATQRGIIMSPSLISAALQAPECRSVPPLNVPGDAVGNLLSMMSVGRMGNTHLLQLSLRGQQPETLACLLNAIVNEYLRRQEVERRSSDEQVLSSLRNELGELESKLKSKGEQYRQLVSEVGRTQQNEYGNSATGAIATFTSMITDAKKVRAVAEGLLANLDQYSDAGSEPFPMPGIDTYINSDVQLNTLKDQLRTHQLAEIADKSLGKGPNHPDVRIRPELIAALLGKIREREEELKSSFAASERRRLYVQVRDASITEKVVHDELVKAQTDKVALARQEFLLEDLQHERDQLERTRDEVKKRIWEVEVEQKRVGRATLASSATIPTRPNIDKRMTYSIAASVMSFVLVVALAFVRHNLDTRFRTPSEVTGRLGMRVLGSVQYVPSRNGNSTPTLEQGLREPVRGISTALLAVGQVKKGHSRLVTSPTAGSGKSSMAINLARSLAATGRRVLLIDGDNSSRGVTRRMELSQVPGLTELLSGQLQVDRLLRPSDAPRLVVLPAGKRSNLFGDLLADRDAQERLRGAYLGFDEVIVDSPPVLANSHALILATLVDEVVLVLRAGVSSREEAEAAKEHLSSVGSRIVGAILNGVDPKRVRYGYGYGYGRVYQTTEQDTEQDEVFS